MRTTPGERIAMNACTHGDERPDGARLFGCFECGATCCPACAVDLESVTYCRACAAVLLDAVAVRPGEAFEVC